MDACLAKQARDPRLCPVCGKGHLHNILHVFSFQEPPAPFNAPPPSRAPPLPAPAALPEAARDGLHPLDRCPFPALRRSRRACRGRNRPSTPVKARRNTLAAAPNRRGTPGNGLAEPCASSQNAPCGG
jgi:hypothetical protein